ncbi:hypothetical protein ACR2XN_28145, partial [Klebsiella pneumoniae]
MWHEGRYKIPPCVNFPLIHDSCLAIDDNVVSDESTYVVNDCPMRDNDNLDAIEILPNLENIVELNTLVDELKFDECPIIIEKEIKIDEIENFALEYRDRSELPWKKSKSGIEQQNLVTNLKISSLNHLVMHLLRS